MTRQDDLQAAIEKNKQYLANKGALDIHNKIEAFQAELLTLDLAEEVDVPLSDDPGEALAQLLARVGLDETASGAAIIAASTPSQVRLFTILGPLGQPGTFPDADYSLFERFYKPSSPPDEENGMQSWEPEDEYATANIWVQAKAAEELTTVLDEA